MARGGSAAFHPLTPPLSDPWGGRSPGEPHYARSIHSALLVSTPAQRPGARPARPALWRSVGRGVCRSANGPPRAHTPLRYAPARPSGAWRCAGE